jgi:hypothetical protein
MSSREEGWWYHVLPPYELGFRKVGMLHSALSVSRPKMPGRNKSIQMGMPSVPCRNEMEFHSSFISARVVVAGEQCFEEFLWSGQGVVLGLTAVCFSHPPFFICQVATDSESSYRHRL